ncbi:MAG: L-arabinose ABC transporter ATP-binding protein AraG [bacterium]
MNTYLQFDSISKSFPGVRALDRVSLSVSEGSVHALIGENGAGKSTLLKILSGAYRPDEGRILLGGQPHVFSTTSAAITAGVAVIYQELHLAPNLSVAENVFLGRLHQRGGWLNKRKLFEATRREMEALGEDIDPNANVGRLSIAQRQMVEIAKALARSAKVVAFDEPTSSLSARETERLFRVIQDLKQRGRVILYISHRLEEIYRICDSATVLRDGRHVETFPALDGVSADAIINSMVGRSITDVYRYQSRPHGSPALEVDGLEGRGLTSPVSFTVAQGEIVGFFGLVGAGRSELMKLIYGAVRARAGYVKVLGQRVAIGHPSRGIRAGIVLCPEDRKKEGIIPNRSVQENINIGSRRHLSWLGFVISERKERANAECFVARLAVKTPSLRQHIQLLSGGNQQKVILARWLGEGMKVILLDEPTRGIDVGAKSEIYSIIYDLARQGIGVVVVSSELPEVLGICDRVNVMRQGKLVAELDRASATAETVLKSALPIAG